jgi:16S rRNA processing protein RimM
VDSISDAEELTGYEVQIPAEQRTVLGAGEYYVSDLIGCEVAANGRELGRINDVDFGAGTAPLLVAHDGKREYLLPFAEEFIQEVDVAGKRVRMQVPDGLLDSAE